MDRCPGAGRSCPKDAAVYQGELFVASPMRVHRHRQDWIIRCRTLTSGLIASSRHNQRMQGTQAHPATGANAGAERPGTRGVRAVPGLTPLAGTVNWVGPGGCRFVGSTTRFAAVASSWLPDWARYAGHRRPAG
jgi:hypothetical protein